MNYTRHPSNCVKVYILISTPLSRVCQALRPISPPHRPISHLQESVVLTCSGHGPERRERRKQRTVPGKQRWSRWSRCFHHPSRRSDWVVRPARSRSPRSPRSSENQGTNTAWLWLTWKRMACPLGKPCSVQAGSELHFKFSSK